METENDFIETKEQILARSPLLRNFLNFALFPNTDEWTEAVDSEYGKIFRDQQDALGENFNQVGPMAIYMLGNQFKVFNPEAPYDKRYFWTCWLVAFGWEIGTIKQVRQFEPDILALMTDFAVFDESRVDDTDYFDLVCSFLDTTAMLGANWKTTAENKTPKIIEDFISKLDIDKRLSG